MRAPSIEEPLRSTGALSESRSSYPASTSNSRRTSATDRAIGPATAIPATASEGRCPTSEIRPGVGFNPAMPQKGGGRRIDPPPSLPTPPGEQPLAMAAASPPDDPPGVRSMFQGLFDRPVM